MHKVFLYLFLLFIPASFSSMSRPEPRTSVTSSCRQLYVEMELDGVVNYAAFEQAVAGYNKITQKDKEILTLVDFSKPSTEERFYVFDMRHKKLLFSSLVSHGKNSGGNYATSFSNENGSLKSSLGFFLTENTYQGKTGIHWCLTGWKKESTTVPKSGQSLFTERLIPILPSLLLPVGWAVASVVPPFRNRSANRSLIRSKAVPCCSFMPTTRIISAIALFCLNG